MAQDENTVRQSPTPEHAVAANAEPAENPNVDAASFAAANPSGLNEDPTTSSQVAARVNTGKTGLARGVGIAVVNLPADTVITTIKAAKGSLDMVTKAVTEVFEQVDELGSAELDNVQVYIDQAQQHLDAILHTAKQAQENAHTDASKTS